MNIFLAKSFFKYYAKASTIYNTDSKFILEFYEKVWQDNRNYYAFSELELYRRFLLNNHKDIEVTDFGAGSHVLGNKKIRKISHIAKSSLSPKWECELLFKLINWQLPQYKIEIGTSLGLSTLYQHLPNPKSSTFYTLEGCPNIAKIAGEKFLYLKEKPQQVIGNFDNTLANVLAQIPRLDYAFIDGNHRYEPTMRYFHACMEKAHAQTILVFDDIYWSEEMTKAWEEICKDERIFLTIDLFKMGIVFVNPTQMKQKQNLSLVPFHYKPWRIGIFR